MNWMQFVLAVTTTLVWSTVVLVTFFIIRREVRIRRRKASADKHHGVEP
jgi:hypothetical protein